MSVRTVEERCHGVFRNLYRRCVYSGGDGNTQVQKRRDNF